MTNLNCKLKISINFYSSSGEFVCRHVHGGGMAAAISFVEELKNSFLISSVDVKFTNVINVVLGEPKR